MENNKRKTKTTQLLKTKTVHKLPHLTANQNTLSLDWRIATQQPTTVSKHHL